jgi:peroxiredoxin
MMAIDTPPMAPDFCLTDTADRTVCLDDYRGRSHLVLVFARGFA